MIKGIVSAVPANIVKNDDPAFVKMTGVAERRVTDVLAVEEYAVRAARKLMLDMDWSAESIGAIIFVTQTATCRMPAAACYIARDLGVTCPAFDVNLACSGYVYGLWLASLMLMNHTRRVLLIAGDTVSRMCDPNDKSTYPLFGDAVTATAIEDDGKYTAHFNLGTDGSGFGSLIADPLIRMDGAEVFNFALKAVPKLVADTTANAHVDWYLFHQANMTMLKALYKKLKGATPMPTNIQRYGNTSSASIPLLMCDSMATESLMSKPNRVAMFGFGAGWSWGGCMIDLEPLKVLEVVEV